MCSGVGKKIGLSLSAKEWAWPNGQTIDFCNEAS